MKLIHTLILLACRIELRVSMSIAPKRDVLGKSVVKNPLNKSADAPQT